MRYVKPCALLFCAAGATASATTDDGTRMLLDAIYNSQVEIEVTNLSDDTVHLQASSGFHRAGPERRQELAPGDKRRFNVRADPVAGVELRYGTETKGCDFKTYKLVPTFQQSVVHATAQDIGDATCTARLVSRSSEREWSAAFVIR